MTLKNSLCFSVWFLREAEGRFKMKQEFLPEVLQLCPKKKKNCCHCTHFKLCFQSFKRHVKNEVGLRFEADVLTDLCSSPSTVFSRGWEQTGAVGIGAHG